MVSLVVGPEGGAAVMGVTGKVSDIATGVSGLIDFSKGKVGEGLAKFGGIAVSNIVGHLVGPKTASAGVKIAANGLAAVAGNVTERVMKALSKPLSIGHVKKLAPTFTMQRSSIPKTTPPPKPRIKAAT